MWSLGLDWWAPHVSECTSHNLSYFMVCNASDEYVWPMIIDTTCLWGHKLSLTSLYIVIFNEIVWESPCSRNFRKYVSLQWHCYFDIMGLIGFGMHFPKGCKWPSFGYRIIWLSPSRMVRDVANPANASGPTFCSSPNVDYLCLFKLHE